MDPNKLTLRSWYERHFLSLFQPDVRQRTINEYQFTLTKWEKLTCNPMITALTSLTLAEFRSKLSGIVAAGTVNKHLRHVNHLLAKAGPPGPSNRDAMNLLSTIPWVKQLRTFQKKPRAATLQAITTFYRCCPDDWWRAFVVCSFHLGSRVHALTHVHESDVHFGERTIRFAPEHDKKRIERCKPMSTAVVRHLVPLRGAGLLEWSKSGTAFYQAWRRIEANAALTDAEKFRPHDLKRACGTSLARSGASTWAVKFMLDHSQSDVTGCSYIDPVDALREIVELIPDPSRVLSLVKSSVEN